MSFSLFSFHNLHALNALVLGFNLIKFTRTRGKVLIKHTKCHRASCIINCEHVTGLLLLVRPKLSHVLLDKPVFQSPTFLVHKFSYAASMEMTLINSFDV